MIFSSASKQIVFTSVYPTIPVVSTLLGQSDFVVGVLKDILDHLPASP